MIHSISPADLTAEFLSNRIYPDTEHTLYWSDSWEPDFYVELARAGFICISHPHPKLGRLLIPELQEGYALLDWENLHVSRHVRRLMRSGRLEEDGVELTISRSCRSVTDRLLAYHGPRAWLCEPYLDLLSKLMARDRGDFILHGIELWSRRLDELVAGELGYTIGSTYTSLSGFCSRANPRWRHFGTLQMVMLAHWLRDHGYAFWNMGHPHMAYKRALGARVVSRHAFLKRWLAATRQPLGRAWTSP